MDSQSNLSEILACIPLEIGNSQAVDISQERSPTGVLHNYKLIRTGDHSYRAELNLHFIAHPERYDGPHRAAHGIDANAVEAEFRHFTENCLNAVNPYLKTPDGQTLEIRLSSPTDSAPPRLQRIQIGSRNHRADSEEYSSEMGCATLVHEFFHLLGLVDEYPESSIGFHIDPLSQLTAFDPQGGDVHAYDCRTLGPSHSVMRDPLQALAGALPLVTYQVQGCQCSLSPGVNYREQCGARVQSLLEQRPSLTSCPLGFEPSTRTIRRYKGLVKDTLNSETFFALESPTAQAIAERPPSRNFILFPAQLRAIVYPGCFQQNQQYYQCAYHAYQCSVRLTGGCLPAPPACRQGGENWLR